MRRPKVAAKVHPMDRPRMQVDAGRVCSQQAKIEDVKVNAAPPIAELGRSFQGAPTCGGATGARSGGGLDHREPPTAPPEESEGDRPAPPHERPPQQAVEPGVTASRGQPPPSRSVAPMKDAAPGTRAAEHSRTKASTLPSVHKGNDKVPDYLRRRMAKAEETRRREALPRPPKAPPGYRRVSEAERLGSLEALAKQRKAAQAVVNSLPFRIETLAQRRREKEAIEHLDHVEKLEAMFGQPEVYVPDDMEPLAALEPPPIHASGSSEQEEWRRADRTDGHLPKLPSSRSLGKHPLGNNRSRICLF